MTLSKLAKLANVSVATASKAFSMSREVNEETRAMIFRVAQEQGCFKKLFNAKYPRPVVAVLCPELQSRYYGALVRRIQVLLEQQGCEVCVSTSEFRQQAVYSQMDYYERYAAVDGIIAIGSVPPFLTERETPLVICGQDCNGVADACVHIDAQNAMREAIALCMQSGRRDIAFIGEGLTREKYERFAHILQEDYGVAVARYVESTQRFEEGGYEAFEQLQKSSRVPQAVICAYDSMAYGVLRAAKDYGIRVPEDLFVIGYNNLPQSAYTVPRLTSLDMQDEEVARALTTMLQCLFNGTNVPKEVTVSASLCRRESTDG